MTDAGVVCESCGAPIAWVMCRRKDGKLSKMPIDLDPVPNGNLAVYRDHLGGLKCRTLARGEAPEPYERRGVTHLATCKFADRYRRRPDGLPENVIPLHRRRGA